jgi:serine palmitoyltransferase
VVAVLGMASPYVSAGAPYATPLPAQPTATSVAAEQLVSALAYSLNRLGDLTSRVPGSAIAWRYLKASHQDDPFRTVLELLLVFFIVRTYLMARTKGESSGKNFVALSEKVSRASLGLVAGRELRCGRRADLHLTDFAR